MGMGLQDAIAAHRRYCAADICVAAKYIAIRHIVVVHLSFADKEIM
jgi:hypothetical protein